MEKIPTYFVTCVFDPLQKPIVLSHLQDFPLDTGSSIQDERWSVLLLRVSVDGRRDLLRRRLLGRHGNLVLLGGADQAVTVFLPE